NLTEDEAISLVEGNFKLLNGKSYYSTDSKLIIAKFIDDKILENFIIENKFATEKLKITD
ncbi:hypothetical protein, partial [Flavobacterium filum]|uniref:hypothetical protein n=1 Tax=Flavobacterium filum TaxID=370974 RepID=UPI0023F3C71B